MSQTASTVMRRKISAIQARGYHSAILRALAARLESAAAKAATALLGVASEAVMEQSLVGRQGNILATLPEPGLIASLGMEGGVTGLVAFDTALVDHIVDILMGGDPGRPRTLPARLPTAIDAALCRRLADHLFARFDEEIHALTSGSGLGAIRWLRVERSRAELHGVLPDRQYLIFRVTLDIGDADRSGSLHLALPLAAVEPIEAALRNAAVIPSDDESEEWARHMRRVVAATPLRLEAVLERSRVAVAELARLEVGEVIPLPDVTLDDVTLEIEVAGRTHTIATGRLGSYRRNKAVRLAAPPDHALLAPLAEALHLPPPCATEETPPPEDAPITHDAPA